MGIGRLDLPEIHQDQKLPMVVTIKLHVSHCWKISATFIDTPSSTAVGLDTGLAISTLTIFFIFTINKIDAPQWW